MEGKGEMNLKLNRRDFLMISSAATGALLLGEKADALSNEPSHQVGDVKYIPTRCLNCTTSCGIVVKVKDGKAVKIDGNRLDPNTRGTICAKGQAAINQLYNPDRIIYPMRRVGKRGEHKWERISWDEALGEVAERLIKLKELGREEEFVFQHGRSKLGNLKKRFCWAYGTPNDLNHTSICSNNIRIPISSFFGRNVNFDCSDFAHTKYILNFGSNFFECHQGGHHIAKRAMEAMIENEAKLVTFDVRLSNTAAKSDEWHQVFPGTEGAVALAMGNVILSEGLFDGDFIETWTTSTVNELKDAYKDFTPEWAGAISTLSAADIRRLAREFAASSPRCIAFLNRGIHAHSNGFYSSRAVYTLNALVGNIGKPGGFQYPIDGGKKEWGIKISEPEPFPEKPKKNAIVAFPPEYPYSWTQKVGGNTFLYWKNKREKVSMYMGYCINAVYSWPEGPTLAREVFLDEELIPFHVAIDPFYSEQTSLSDIILPDATFLEKYDNDQREAYDYIPFVGLRQPVVKPLGESRDVREILRELSQRIGHGMERYFHWKDTEDYMRMVFANIPSDKNGIGGFERMKRDGVYVQNNFPANLHPSYAGKKGYEFFKWELTDEQMRDTYSETIALKNGKKIDVLRKKGDEKKANVGVIRNGRAYHGFHTTKTGLFEIYQEDIIKSGEIASNPDGSKLKGRYPALLTYIPIPGHNSVKASDEKFILTTFKVNVHTQSRTANHKLLSEIWHYNPAWINRTVGERLHLKEGDEIIITVWRHPYRAFGDKAIVADSSKVGEFRVKVHLTDAIHPKAIAISNHCGHWEYGRVAAPIRNGSDIPYREFTFASPDRCIDENIWWSKEKGGVGNGYAPNSVMQITPDPITGQQGWYDNIATIKKV
ncbi:MAG: molybdopterin-dependent oxidoreductase [Nitrospinota bacterium]